MVVDQVHNDHLLGVRSLSMDSNTAGLPFAGSNGQKLFGIVHQEHLSTSVEMHAVLQLTEITEVMCEFLDRPTLARLARTCRAFQEPALDALWKVLLGLEPLARLLPDSMWISEEDPAGSGSRYKLLQPLSLQQWRLIQKYTSRISVISSYYTMTSSDNRLQAIALHWPPAFEPFPPLFPRLKAIRGACPGRDNVLLFHWLNGPSLTELEIRSLLGDLASQRLIDFVSDMGTIYPNIKIFTHNAILDKERPETMIQGLSKTIRSWKHLEHVDLHTLDLDTAAYEHLMRLESLTSLTLMLASEVLPRLRQAVLPRKPFPALTDLTLVDRDYHIPWMTVEWLNCLHLSPSSLSCRTRRSSADPQQITDLCRAIAAQLCHKSLEMILLMDYGNSTSVEVDSIRPLFSFSRLRCATLANLCTTSLSDDDLLDLATSWPLLQVMSLNYYVNTQTRGVVMPTLEGFCHLLLHCPRLHKLTIVIDARDAEWVEVACPWDDVRNHPMNYLCLGNSFLDDAKRVASILSTLPSLKEVDTTCWDVYPLMGIPERETLSPLWEEVNHHLVELRDC